MKNLTGEPAGKATVYIVAERPFYGHFMSCCIRERLKLSCICCNDWDKFAANLQGALISPSLLLCPAKFFQPGVANSPANRYLLNNNHKVYVVLYGIEHDEELESNALVCGVRGIFRTGDGIDIFEKGIKTILAGDLWFSRHVSSKTIAHIQGQALSPAVPGKQLTARERQILAMVASG